MIPWHCGILQPVCLHLHSACLLTLLCGTHTRPQIEGLPTVVFIPKDATKPALRTEGLLPAAQIIEILNDL